MGEGRGLATGGARLAAADRRHRDEEEDEHGAAQGVAAVVAVLGWSGRGASMDGFDVGGGWGRWSRMGPKWGMPGGHPAADAQPVDVLSVCELRLDPLRFGHGEVEDVLEPAHKDHPAEEDAAGVVRLRCGDAAGIHSPPPRPALHQIIRQITIPPISANGDPPDWLPLE